MIGHFSGSKHRKLIFWNLHLQVNLGRLGIRARVMIWRWKIPEITPKTRKSYAFLWCFLLPSKHCWISFFYLDENTDSFHYLVDANNASEWMWTIYYEYMAGVIMNMISLCGLSVFYCWVNKIDDDNDGHLDTVNFYHPLDTNTYGNCFFFALKWPPLSFICWTISN